MQVTNTTSYDIYFGPLRLAANASNVTIDDTSDTSLYLTDDTVADALNNAYLAGKITVSGEAQPFPRPTGDPQLLHGLGSPEGSVYAPPGSLMMRRDSTGAGDALYAKTTPRTSSTGWQTFRVPVTSAISAGPPSDPLDGDVWIATGVDANGTRWAFQYNAGSSSSYKWEFIGGPPVLASIQTDESTTTTSSWVDLATAGPLFTLPRAGDYLCTGTAIMYSTTGGAQIELGIANGATSPSGFPDQFVPGTAGEGITIKVGPIVLAGVSASSDARLRYWFSAATGHALSRTISVLPRRVS